MTVLSTLRQSRKVLSHICIGCGRSFSTRQGLAAHYSSKDNVDCRRKALQLEQERKLEGLDDDYDDCSSPSSDEASSDWSTDSEPRRPRKRTKVTLEDFNEDEPETEDDVVETLVEEHPLGGTTFDTGTFRMQDLRDLQKEKGIPHTAPFADDAEYMWYKWLLRAVPSMTEIDNGLKLDMVCDLICS